jgi:hypothetical protein
MNKILKYALIAFAVLFAVLVFPPLRNKIRDLLAGGSKPPTTTPTDGSFFKFASTSKIDLGSAVNQT